MPISLAIHPKFQLTAGQPAPLSQSFNRHLTDGTMFPTRVSGRNPAIGTTLSDVWGYPNTTTGASQFVRAYSAAAFTLAVVSDSASDTSAGTGAQTVAVWYLDNNYLPWVAVFSLSGLTAVTASTAIYSGFVPSGTSVGSGSITNCFRINNIVTLTAGTGLLNVGNVYAFDNSSTVTSGVPQTTTKVFGMMLPGDNMNSNAAYTVPAGYEGALVMGITGLQTTGVSNVFGKMRLQIDNAGNLVFAAVPINNVACNCAPSVVEQNLISILPPQTNFRVQCQAGATGAEAVALFNLLLWPSI